MCSPKKQKTVLLISLLSWAKLGAHFRHPVCATSVIRAARRISEKTKQKNIKRNIEAISTLFGTDSNRNNGYKYISYI